MLTTTNQLDYSISNIKKGPKNLHVTLKNNGNIPGPVVICGVTDGVISEQVWVDGLKVQKQYHISMEDMTTSELIILEKCRNKQEK